MILTETNLQDAFDNIIDLQYNSLLIEQNINMYILSEEYLYLNNSVIVTEQNIISTIFTAIKTAIVTCAKKIAQFFKSVIDIIGDKLKNLKNKITSFGESTILTESDNDYIDLSDVYISRLSSSFSVTALYNI